MTGVSKGWDIYKSARAKNKLIEIYRSVKYGREYAYTNKYVEKGLTVEEDSITALSIFDGKIYFKNTERFENDWFSGEPDIIDSNRTIDIKSSYSLESFPHKETYKLDDDYVYQGLGYMDLTGKKEHVIAYVLVNAPTSLINKEKIDLFYKMGNPSDYDEKYLAGKREIEKKLIYDMKMFKEQHPNYDLDTIDWNYDIPLEDRVFKFYVLYDPLTMDKIKKRLKECRDFLNSL